MGEFKPYSNTMSKEEELESTQNLTHKFEDLLVRVYRDLHRIVGNEDLESVEKQLLDIIKYLNEDGIDTSSEMQSDRDGE